MGFMVVYRRLWMIFALFLLAGCAGTAGTSSLATVENNDVTVDPAADIAAEFKSLRAVQGHFDGGDWNEDVDEWMGRKHQLMIQLESLVGAGGYSRTEVIRLLDPPGLVVGEGDDFFGLVNSLAEFEKPVAGSYELLIYYWRGTHDFLYFTVQDEAIIGLGWWYAGD